MSVFLKKSQAGRRSAFAEGGTPTREVNPEKADPRLDAAATDCRGQERPDAQARLCALLSQQGACACLLPPRPFLKKIE